MKLSELFGRQVPFLQYNPRLAAIAGGITAGIFLAFMIRWTGLQRDPDGWIEKRASPPQAPFDERNPENQSVEAETAMTYKQQKFARRQLRQRNLIFEKRMRSDHRFFFKLNLPQLLRAWLELDEKEGSGTSTEGAVEQELKRLAALWAPGNNANPSVPAGSDPEYGKAAVSVPEGLRPTYQKDADSVPEGFSLNGTSREDTENTFHRGDQGGKVLSILEERSEKSSAMSSETDPAAGDFRLKVCGQFERIMEVQHWPWDTDPAFSAIADMLVSWETKVPGILRQYEEWLKGPASRKAFSAKQIRIGPGQFLDTGWPLFLASRGPRLLNEPPVEGELARKFRAWQEANGAHDGPGA